MEVDNPHPPAARKPNLLLVSMLHQAPLLMCLYRAAEGWRVARGETLRRQGQEMVARGHKNASDRVDWTEFNGHLEQIALANVTGHGGGADALTRAEINSYGKELLEPKNTSTVLAF